jgi:prepilin-type N-terminal cleavage/methylation domain-containing protein/prepilin-type processing-associated H-X9-DG protein
VERGFTLLEAIIAVAIMALLMSIAIPGLHAARARGKSIRCAANMRALGQGLVAYCTSEADVLPLNTRTWELADARTRWLSGGPEDNVGWTGAIGRSMCEYSPWLWPLRCPNAVVIWEARPTGGFVPVVQGGPGANWYLNSYCSGRKLSSIPKPADGVLLLEVGVWDRRSCDTGALEDPYSPWAYPHPDMDAGRLDETGRWAWLPASGRRSGRNLLWCDGHVEGARAGRWPNGDQPEDADRIRHMRFGLPPSNDWDPAR